MKRSKKLGYLLGLLILILFSGTLILSYYKVAPANFKFTGKPYVEAHSFIMTDPYWQQFMFWVAVAIAVVAVIAFIIVLIYPRQIDAYVFKDKKSKSKLRISRKAIAGFVTSSLADQKVVSNPKVKLNVRKRKLLIEVKGSLTNSASDLTDLEKRWAEKLAQDLNDMLGITQKKKIKVHIVNTKPAKKSSVERNAPKKSRVV
ncbi:hypothetical protein JOC36_000558 [Weissella uvarum]|uniref:alkaline shock response membrane anchor protein AmaP n=1 Tax=Weissella uvarum TaxID=1479233 RepID=UPI00195F4BAA|nr:hypothetical protein [Weissella uvarum]MCM0595307.1 alkaline shock response membrane anchor protein AmaP [Weissella uvarum]